MSQEERLDYLIKFLLGEDKQYIGYRIPKDIESRKKILRSLMNIRQPKKISRDFLKIQDLYLQEELYKTKAGILRQTDITIF